MSFHIPFHSYSLACFILVVTIFVQFSFAQNDCWTTGCQPSDWAVVGCDQYGRTEQGTTPCTDGRGVSGFQYTCCAGQASGDDSNIYRKARRFDSDDVHADQESLGDDEQRNIYQDW